MSEKDTIYRQDAIDALRDVQHRFTVADEAGGFGTVKWSEDVIYFAAAERVLSDLPSADRPRGKWIEGETFYFCGEQRLPMKCSVCGRTALNEPWCYCPNCGADMRGEKNE